MALSIDELFLGHDHLGFFNPYYCWNDNRICVQPSFPGILESFGGRRLIDPAALVEMINGGFLFGERTLIQGISKTPWMGRPNADGTGWVFADLPPHGQRGAGPQEIGDGLFSRLCTELETFCRGRTTVGLLLSGGMDSRVAACALDHLHKTHQIRCVLVGLTWGAEGSRDVVYARRITQMLGWEFRHYPIGPDNLAENLLLTAERGCEFSPVHLHAMPRVAETTGLDGLVAASYGDSVGRAEFSGTHVSQLRPLVRYLLNRFKLLRAGVFEKGFAGALEDNQQIHQRFPRPSGYQQREIEQISHYMQRLPNNSMAFLAEKMPLFQAFTSPEVFGYMWSFSPEARTDTVYKCLLERHGKELLEVPWARTGKPYLSIRGRADANAKEFNCYGEWMRRDLRTMISKRLCSDALDELGVFNTRSLKSLQRLTWLNSGPVISQVEQFLFWIAAVAEYTERYGIQADAERGRAVREAIDGWLVSVCHSLALSGRVAVLQRWRSLRG